ncbi:MAG: PilZ domain-containing protein [Candidatus Sulfotelmatobacter sp.]
MEIFTPKATRRSTRIRVEIPITVTSLDRKHVFAAECVALVVSAQGCGFRTPQALPLETPVLLGNLPGGGTASGRVANCLPLGSDGTQFLIGVSLYNPGNVWGITDPPADWNCAPTASPASASAAKATPASKNVWPYNVFSGQREAHPSRK